MTDISDQTTPAGPPRFLIGLGVAMVLLPLAAASILLALGETIGWLSGIALAAAAVSIAAPVLFDTNKRHWLYWVPVAMGMLGLVVLLLQTLVFTD